MQAFRGARLRALVRPERVSPDALTEMAGTDRTGAVHVDALALDRVAADPGADGAAAGDQTADLEEILSLQEQSMLRLGGALQAA